MTSMSNRSTGLDRACFKLLKKPYPMSRNKNNHQRMSTHLMMTMTLGQPRKMRKSLPKKVTMPSSKIL